MKNKDLRDYQNGSGGNPFASGWGQVGYEQHKRNEARKRVEQNRKIEGARHQTATSPVGNYRRDLLTLCFVIIGLTLLNFDDYLTSLQQFWVIGIVTPLLFVIYKYWTAFKWVIFTLIVLLVIALANGSGA